MVGVLAYEYFKPKYHEPKLNPSPKYFLTIEGTVAPAFRGTGHLVFMASYSTSKDPCFHETNYLAGMIQGESKTKYYWIKPDKNSHYKIKIPMDKYVPGTCGWIPYTVAMDFAKDKKDANEYAFASVYKTMSQKFNPSEITYICSVADLNKCDLHVKSNKAPCIVLRQDQSYKVEVNMDYKKGMRGEIMGLFNTEVQ